MDIEEQVICILHVFLCSKSVFMLSVLCCIIIYIYKLCVVVGLLFLLHQDDKFKCLYHLFYLSEIYGKIVRIDGDGVDDGSLNQAAVNYNINHTATGVSKTEEPDSPLDYIHTCTLNMKLKGKGINNKL